MTFTSHSTDFAVNLHYGAIDYLSKEQLEEFGLLNITDVTFNGIVEAIKKNVDADHIFKGIKAYFLIDFYGLIRNDGAEVIIEQVKKNATLDSIVESIGKFFGSGTEKEETKEGLKEEATTQPPEDKASDNTENAEQESKDDSKESEKTANETESAVPVKNETMPPVNETATKTKNDQKPKVIKSKLKVKLYSAFADLSKENIKDSKKSLSAFERIEKLKAERDAAHNGLEARVYEIKERLNNEDFISFAQGNEIENLTKILEVTATWLEDDADVSTPTEEFRAKQAPIDEIIFAIEKRIRDLIEAEMKKKAEEEAKKKAERDAKLKAEADAKKKEEEAAKAANETVTGEEDAEKQEAKEEDTDSADVKNETLPPLDESATDSEDKAHEEF